jgi:hypothetical protein
MAILQLYPPKEFYSSVDPRAFQPGQFCWIPVPHPDPIPRILDVDRSSPEEHSQVKFLMRNANSKGDFRTNDRGLPIKYLNLRSNEELLVQRAKKRPGIIICSEVDVFPAITELLRSKRKKHLQEDCLFVIPCYGIETRENSTGFPAEMVERIRCLLYRQFFYLPPYKAFTEGIARLDRIQVVIGRDPASIEPSDFSLSKEVFDLFLAIFLYCISGIEDEDLAPVRSLIMETYAG